MHTESAGRGSSCASKQHNMTDSTTEVAQLPATDALPNKSKFDPALPRTAPGVDVIKLHSSTRVPSTSSVTKKNTIRRAPVNLHCDCPIDAEALLMWIKYFPDTERVSEIIDRFPVLFSEPYMQSRRPTVLLRLPPSSYNHVISRGVLTSVNSALSN